MTTDKINLVSKLARFQDHWKPRTVAQLNEYDIMVVKVQGECISGRESSLWCPRALSIRLTQSRKRASC